MTMPMTPRRTTADYQALDAAHHIHAFLDQKALNAVQFSCNAHAYYASLGVRI